MNRPLAIASYNLHKGLSFFGGRLVVHEMRDRLLALAPDIVFLQEVQGHHALHHQRFAEWPQKPMPEFMAAHFWDDFAYGKNAVYEHGHHGNAILSRYPITRWENIDISAHPFEQRGLLHCEIEVPGFFQPLHAICLHLALTEGSRQRQLQRIVERIRAAVPADAPLILAGDFNDWRVRADNRLRFDLHVREVFEAAHGYPAKSFPAALPMFRLDRIYVRGFTVRKAMVQRGGPWRRLSDHAALSAELSLSEPFADAA